MSLYRKILKYVGLDYEYFINSKNAHIYYLTFLNPFTLAGIILKSKCPFTAFIFVYGNFINLKLMPLSTAVIIYQTYLNLKREIPVFDLHSSRLIYFIQSNHLESLKTELEFNPSYSKLLYKKKSLLFWCKHYKNVNAHTMIVEYMKKDLA